MFTAGPTRLTSRLWLRGSRSLRTLTGTGLAHPKGGAPESTRMAGRIRVPKRSTWGTGLRVRRPARRAVSSPNSRARAPCDTSWRMIEGISTARNSSVSDRTTWRLTTRIRMRAASTASTTLSREERGLLLTGSLAGTPPLAGPQVSALRGAVDALAGGGHGLETGLGDRLPARLADPVGARPHLVQRPLDLVQGVPQAGRQRLRLPPLGRDLAGVGEVGVVVQPPAFVSEAELGQLPAQVVPLLLQLRALTRQGGVTPGHCGDTLPGLPDPGARMSMLVNLPQTLGRHPCVHLRGGDGCVPQKLLNDTDVGPVVEHVGGAGVTQNMGCQAVAQPHPVAVLAHDPPRPLPAQTPSARVEEHGFGVAPPGPAGRSHGAPAVGA